MKKTFALLLAVVMVLCLFAGCVENNPGTTAGTNPSGATNPTDPSEPAAPDYSAYYQTYEAEDLGSVNYWDSKSETPGNMLGYIASGFWGTVMNEEKDGYDWICELAKEKPVAQNADANGLATIYKFEVKVGSELVYNTLSQKAEFAAFKGREVKLEDYLTAWKAMYTQSNAIERGAEGLSGAGSIKGLYAFYEGTADGFDQDLWDAVGITATEENGKAYLQFEFNVPCNSFYAMYYLASNLYSPIPQDFLDLVGGLKNYGIFIEDGDLSPVDTALSTSYYVLESWQSGKEIVFKKNDLYVDNGRYQIPGVYIMVLPAIKNDSEAALKEFLAGKLDAVGIPSTQLDNYRDDPRTTTTLDSSTTKLNLNTCTMEEWEALFGENGSITQTPKEAYWDVKPIMSNDNFLKGLNYCIDRDNLASELGATPTANYFGSAYLSDPENGVSYNTTEAHKNAVAGIQTGTVNGYSLALAQQHFKAACEELIASGAYNAGDTVTIEIAWQTQSNVDNTGKYIEQYITSAFNSCGGGLTLAIKHEVMAVWTDVYYKKMMIGQFDIGFGSISGNSLNPLNFFEVLRSDNTSGFTLNWGVDTSVVDPSLAYDGRQWSFNSLWEAADRGALVEPNGKLIKSYDANLHSITDNADGTRTVKFNVGELNIDVASSEVAAIVPFGCSTEDYSDYVEESVEFTIENGIATITLSADQVAVYDAFTYAMGYDIYFNVTDPDGNVSETYISIGGEYDEENACWKFRTFADPIVMATAGEWVTYVAASYEERTVILGILEKYAVDNFLTGLTVYGDGGYVMYQDRVNPGTGDWSNYIPGYGFGILAEGDLLG